MTVLATKTPEVRSPLLERLRASLGRETGADIRFYAPDGTALAGGFDDMGDPFAGAVREVAATGLDRTEPALDGTVGFWPVRRRSRVWLVACAYVAEEEPAVAERVLAALAVAVRARLALAEGEGETAALSEALTQTYEEVTVLHRLGEVLRVTRPEHEMLERACAELRQTIGADAVAAWSAGGIDVAVGRLPVDRASLGELVAHILDDVGDDAPVVINNHCADDPRLASLAPDLARLILVPLALGDGVRGAVVAMNRGGEEFGSPDVKLVRSVATSLGIFIENRRLYRDLEQMMLELVRAMVSAIDAKDPYTCGHSERVAVTSREVAARLGLAEGEVQWAYLAGLLHDVGKIGTPEAILLKDGKLEADERSVINRHPDVGARILGDVRSLDPLRDAVRYHHERWDGSGYPDGLEGEAIPLLARIVGLADAFDAMTSDRPYRRGLPLETVRSEIRHSAGRQFDPAVVDALFSIDLARLLEKLRDLAATAAAPAVTA